MSTRPPALLGAQYRRLTSALMLTTALVAFESLSVVAALAQIGEDLESFERLPWVVTSFLLAMGLAIVSTGRLVDRLGARSTFRWSATLFLLSSALCAASQSILVLVVGRALQGAGAGGFMATSGAAVGLGYPPRVRARVFALNATVWGVLAFGGPALGGLLLATLGWRSIFWINVPLVAICLVLGWRSFPEAVQQQSGSERFDWPGFFWLAIAFTSAVVGLGALSVDTLWWLALGTVSAFVYARHARRVPRALMGWQFFAEPPYSHLAMAAGGAMAAGVAVENFLPLYLQVSRNVAVEWAAWSVLFLTVGWTLSANVASRMYERFSEAAVIVAGALLMPGVLVLALLCVDRAAALPLLMACFFGLGCGIGALTNAALTLVQEAADAREVGGATSTHQFARSVATTLGTAVGGAFLVGFGRTGPDPGSSAHDVSAASSAAPHLAPEPAPDLTSDLAASVAAGFAAAHLAALAFSLLGVLGAVLHYRASSQSTPNGSREPGYEPG